MNKKISAIIGIVLSITILIYFEDLVYIGLDKIGVNVSNLNSLLKTIINISIKLFMCFFVYFVYKKDLKRKYSQGRSFLQWF